MRIAIFFLFIYVLFFRFNFSINVVQLLLKFYDFFKIFYIMQFILITDVFFDLIVLIDCADYLLTYGNIKMARHR